MTSEAPLSQPPHRPRQPWRWSALGLLAALAACGGGGSDPAPTVSVQFTAPAANDVVTAGATIPLSARVTVNAANANDGTAVQFTGTSGTAAAGSTKTGIATSTLGGTTAGKLQLQASATVSGQTGTDTRFVYVRPAPSALEVLVPAYFYPTGAGATAWSALTAGVRANPSVKVTAILNPSNGVFSQADSAIVAASTAYTNAGGALLGYVYTRYGAGERSLAAIKANIDTYLATYGRGLISGIFLDEMASTSDKLAFYQELYAYIKAKDASLRVVGNPGMVPVAGYAAVADTLVTFEGKGSTYQSYDPRSATTAEWLYTRSNQTQASLVHNVADCAAMQTAAQAAASARYNTGWFYATDLLYEPSTEVGNPWAALPGYWTQLLQTVGNLNAGQALPAC